MAIMTNQQLVSKLQDIVDNYDTVYAYGVFGGVLAENLLTQKKNQYSWFYTSTKMAELRGRIGAFGFDCVNLLKGILWGWNGSKDKSWGGAKYVSNGVPDTNADGMINLCKNVSTNFNNIEIGEALWIPGHFGIYIGNGKAIECTPAWKNKVQVTAVGNMGNISGLPTRTWNKHGKLPWIDYAATITPTQSDKISVGDKVVIKAGALYSGASKGKVVPAWAVGKTFTVGRINGTDILLNEINSWVSLEYLQKV